MIVTVAFAGRTIHDYDCRGSRLCRCAREAWSDEIVRRVREVDEGLVELMSAEGILREARERIDAIRRAASARENFENLKDEPE